MWIYEKLLKKIELVDQISVLFSIILRKMAI